LKDDLGVCKDDLGVCKDDLGVCKDDLAARPSVNARVSVNNDTTINDLRAEIAKLRGQVAEKQRVLFVAGCVMVSVSVLIAAKKISDEGLPSV